MKKRKTLTFQTLSSELELVIGAELYSLKGGFGGGVSDIDGGVLDDVPIYSDGDSGWDWDTGDPFPDDNPWYEGGYDFENDERYHGESGGGGGSGGGHWSEVNGERIFTYDGGTLGEVAVTVGYTASDAIGAMLSSVGITATTAEISAVLMKLEASGFKMASRGVGIAAVANSFADIYKDPTPLNYAQSFLGVSILVSGAGPLLLLVGSVGLFVSEVVELYEKDHPKP